MLERIVREGEFGAAFGHNGDGPGYCYSGFYFLAQQCAVAVIANVENSDLSFATILKLYRDKAGASCNHPVFCLRITSSSRS